MKVVGIIAEYNPFHLGHAYQIRKARELFGEETAIVAVMSGDFVQRGEPAIVSKWVRAHSALLCGADLVIEIPFTFACASAERFAQGAVRLLQATGIVTDLYFGSEFTDLSVLMDLSAVLCEESPAFIAILRATLKDGHSYAKAREIALTAHLAAAGRTDLARKCAQILHMPNAILAVEYLTALQKTGSTIAPSVLLRSGAGYHDSSLSSKKASACAIRRTVASSIQEGVCSVSSLADQLAGKMPPESLSLMLSEWSAGIRPVISSDFIPEAILSLRTHTATQLDDYAYMSDQVSHRLKNAVAGLRSTSKGDLPESFWLEAGTKRYAGTRISRALISLVCGQTQSDLTCLNKPEYLRILGFSDQGRYLLKIMRKTAVLPRIDKASDFLEYGKNDKLTRMAELDLISAELWGLKAGYIYGAEYEHTVIRTKGKKN